MKSLLSPLFTFFFYSHSPKEYGNLREKCRQKLMKYFRCDSEFKEYYEKNKGKAEVDILMELEKQYPTPLYWNDIAGFVAIRIENPIEAFRIVAEVWDIKNRKVKTKKIFVHHYGTEVLIDKGLINEPEKFNNEFFDAIENIIGKINKNYLSKKRFYFSLEDNRLNWKLIKTVNISKFLKDLGSNWLY